MNPPAGAGAQVLLLTTARNEARFAEGLFDGVVGQTRRPDRWVLVDDGSTDGTFSAFSRLAADAPWITVLRREPGRQAGGDSLALAADARALNWVLDRTDWAGYTHIGKLDADVILPPDYLGRLLDDFARDSRLGMTAGMLVERRGGHWRELGQPATYAAAPARLCTRECFVAAGGFRERLGWDTIDQVYARMSGFSTRVNRGLRVRHLRPFGSADGRLRGYARHGACAWISHYPWWFALLRAAKVGAGLRPYGISGLAFLVGFAASGLRATPRVEDAGFRAFVRGELRARLRRAATLRRSR